MKRRSVLLLSVSVVVAATTPSAAQFFDDFSRPNGPVDGWTIHQGNWMIEGEAAVATSHSHRGNELPWLWAGNPAISFDRPFEASLSFEFTAPTINTARHEGGIMFCARAPLHRQVTTGYTIEWQDILPPHGPRWSLFRWDGTPGPHLLAETVVAPGLPDSEWDLEVTDDRIILSVGGVEVINQRDRTYRRGHFGVWVFGDGGAVRVDDVRITPPAEPCSAVCDGLTVDVIDEETANIRATATASDESGSAISYTFAADNGAGDVVTIGPQLEDSALFDLPVGADYTIRVTVADGIACDPPAANSSCATTITLPRPGGGQLSGDCNQDGRFDVSDGVCLLNLLFSAGGRGLPCEDSVATAPGNVALLDGNGDGGVDISDAVRVFGFLFLGGPPPVLGTECVLIEGCPSVCVQ